MCRDNLSYHTKNLIPVFGFIMPGRNTIGWPQHSRRSAFPTITTIVCIIFLSILQYYHPPPPRQARKFSPYPVITRHHSGKCVWLEPGRAERPISEYSLMPCVMQELHQANIQYSCSLLVPRQEVSENRDSQNTWQKIRAYHKPTTHISGYFLLRISTLPYTPVAVVVNA